MKLLEINSKIDDFKSKIQDLKEREEKIKKSLEVVEKENDEITKEYNRISNSKSIQDKKKKEKEESTLNKQTIISFVLAIGTWVIIGILYDGTSGFFSGVVVWFLYGIGLGIRDGIREKGSEKFKSKDKTSKIDKEFASISLKKHSSDSKYSSHNKSLNEIQSKIEELQKKTISNNKLISFNQYYDVDDNGLLDIAESTNIEKIIKNKQKEIREIEKKENRDYLKDFSKISLFLNSFQSQLVSDYNDIQNSGNDYGLINSKIEDFEKDYKIYKTLLSSMILMVSHVVNDNTLDFYKLRELFDKLSVFESNFEKNLLGELRSLNQVTSELISITLEARDEIMSELSFLDSSISNVEFELQYLNKK